MPIALRLLSIPADTPASAIFSTIVIQSCDLRDLFLRYLQPTWAAWLMPRRKYPTHIKVHNPSTCNCSAKIVSRKSAIIQTPTDRPRAIYSSIFFFRKDRTWRNALGDVLTGGSDPDTPEYNESATTQGALKLRDVVCITEWGTSKHPQDHGYGYTDKERLLEVMDWDATFFGEI